MFPVTGILSKSEFARQNISFYQIGNGLSEVEDKFRCINYDLVIISDPHNFLHTFTSRFQIFVQLSAV